MPLLFIDNDSLKLKTMFPEHHFQAENPYAIYNYFSYSYPYIYYTIQGGLKIEKYNSTTNQLIEVDTILNAPNYYIHGVVSNGTNVITVEVDYGSPYYSRLEMYKYAIDTDTLIDRSYQCFLGDFMYAPPTEGWALNDDLGIKLIDQGWILFNPDNPCGGISRNVTVQWPYIPITIKNSVYRIGPNDFYYLKTRTVASLVFKQFIMPVIPSIPNLIYPINHQQVSPDTVNFLWYSSSNDVTDYSVQVSTDSLFNTSIDTIVTVDSLTLINLKSNKNYFWRVRARNVVGWSDYSETGAFSTLVTGITLNTINPYEFSLSQNYPNPFNPSTKISWQSPVGSWQTLKIYDVLGNLVATLVDEYKPAGNYEVEFNASSIKHQPSSGIYFYQLKTGSFIETKKMILIK